MDRIARAPPVVGLALALGAGVLFNQTGAHPSWALPLLLLLLRPTHPSSRPSSHLTAFVLAISAGAVHAHFWQAAEEKDCRFHLAENSRLELSGRFSGPLTDGRGLFRPEVGEGPHCSEPVRVVLATGLSLVTAVPPTAGVGGAKETPPAKEAPRVRVPEPDLSALFLVSGVWRRSEGMRIRDPLRAGYLRVDEVSPVSQERGKALDRGILAGRVQLRLRQLFPHRAPMVEALVLARKEGLAPELREAFARAGTAHLLAISGFHVGVVGGLLLLLAALLGLPHRMRFLLAASGVWGYVLLIGLPDAAARAALILTLLSAGRMKGRSVVPVAVLASAFALFLTVDPGSLFRPGFQLSFAGALGLILWARPTSRWLSAATPFPLPSGVSTGVAAGVSATLATLPLVIWHFGRVSLVGIPVTLLAAPLIVFAIPGILFSLLISFVSPGLGAASAQGVDLVLWLFSGLVTRAGSLPFASTWVSRPGLFAGMAGLIMVVFLHRRGRVPSHGRIRRLMVGAAAGLILWPMADAAVRRGGIEMVFLDVGQGDALLIRSPKGRWVLVDAGPRTSTFDAGARVVLPYLRRRGVGELALVILTHPDMDHVGGAESILEEMPTGAVLDPGWAAGSGVFLDALQGARREGVPWVIATAGDSLDVDGMALRVLWPQGRGEGGVGGKGFVSDDQELRALVVEDGANAVSVVVELRFGGFTALLTGDAPAEVEERILGSILSKGVALLKVGHHGSRTSTSSDLLQRISPQVAVVSVGRRNRYGHPHPAVLQRLQDAGVRVFRTDSAGALTLRARGDGSFRVIQERGGESKSVSVDPRRR